jgi:septal ring factor EnvC (AmiA/AmiB activator)
MTEQEQNKKINELDRRLTRIEKEIKTLNIDLEPDGRISEAFDHMENAMDSQFALVNENFKQVRKTQDKIRHELADIKGSMEAILQRLTRVDDLPEE